MALLNRLQIIGNLGQKPELRYTANQKAVCNFTVATTERWTDQDTGESKERTEWHRVTVWGKQAVNCSQYLDKGREVYVEGPLRYRERTDGRGVDAYVDAESVQFFRAPAVTPTPQEARPEAPAPAGESKKKGASRGKADK